jgi:hypothetical protein
MTTNILTKLQTKFHKAIMRRNTNEVKFFLKNKDLDPTYHQNKAIRIATQHGYIEIVQALLNDPRIDPTEWNDFALGTNAVKGNFEMLTLLINDKRIDPTVQKNQSIYTCYKFKHMDSVLLFWNQQSVKDTLKNDHPSLYNELIKEDIKEKIKYF